MLSVRSGGQAVKGPETFAVQEIVGMQLVIVVLTRAVLCLIVQGQVRGRLPGEGGWG